MILENDDSICKSDLRYIGDIVTALGLMGFVNVYFTNSLSIILASSASDSSPGSTRNVSPSVNGANNGAPVPGECVIPAVAANVYVFSGSAPYFASIASNAGTVMSGCSGHENCTPQ